MANDAVADKFEEKSPGKIPAVPIEKRLALALPEAAALSGMKVCWLREAIWNGDLAFIRCGQRGRHDLIHKAVWFASRTCLSAILKEAEVKKRIWQEIQGVFTDAEKRQRNIRQEMGRMSLAGRQSGKLNLILFPEDVECIRRIDDEKFHRCWDRDSSDFSSAVAAKEYMAQKLEAVGSKHVPRVLAASRIDDAIAREHLLELQLRQLLQNLSASLST
jgi:hypothetical protein